MCLPGRCVCALTRVSDGASRWVRPGAGGAASFVEEGLQARGEGVGRDPDAAGGLARGQADGCVSAHEGPGAQRFGDKDYDEWNEAWQYIRFEVSGVFAYRLRLPKGLQHKKIPEIQIEIPAVEMTRSPFKTVLIGGERRSLGEKLEIASARKGEKRETVSRWFARLRRRGIYINHE